MSTEKNEQEINDLKAKIRELLMKPENEHLLKANNELNAERDIIAWSKGKNTEKPENHENELVMGTVSDKDIEEWALNQKIQNR